MNLGIATVGDNCIDRYLAPVNLSTVGGNAVNVAVNLALLGQKISYFGAVGRDRDGERTLAALSANGVDTENVHVLDGPTAYTEVLVGADGDRSFVHEQFGVCAGYAPDSAETALLCQMRHVHLGWLDDGGALKRILVTAGVSVSQDFAVNKSVGDVSILFDSVGPSLPEAERLAAKMLAAGARLAVVTMGSGGSFASDGRSVARSNIRKVEIVDTNGAGDTFIAGFIDAHLAGLALPTCLDLGRDLAASTCRHFGGFPQVPLPFDG
jgi:fructoselysine 6-kinase